MPAVANSFRTASTYLKSADGKAAEVCFDHLSPYVISGKGLRRGLVQTDRAVGGLIISGEAAEPFLSLTPDGHLYAEWHASWRRHLDVEFTADGQVYFGLFNNGNILEGKLKLDDFHPMITGGGQNPFCWCRR